ncbi:hypothetical protein OEZ86_013317 [Tetradesmus obliquus]|nr:hypothetical protein OEZ86_013317 [Tetradesmus obliquus]
MSPSQRLLFTDEVELPGPLPQLQQCCTGAPTLSARGSGSLKLRASPAPSSPASSLHAAAVVFRLQELGSPVRHAAEGDGGFEGKAKRRSTTAPGDRRCTADIGVLQHFVQHHPPAAAAAQGSHHQQEQQQRQQQQQQQQRRSSEARREVRSAGAAESPDEGSHAPVQHGTPYPIHEFAAVEGPATAAELVQQNADSPVRRSSLASSRQPSKGYSGAACSRSSSSGQCRASNRSSNGDVYCSLSRQGSKHGEKQAVSFAEGVAAADGDSASQGHSTPYPAREHDSGSGQAVTFATGTAAAEDGDSANKRHSTPQPGREHSGVAVSFAEGTAAADGSTATQRHGTPFPAREDDPAVTFAAGTAAADGDSVSRRHSTPHPGKEHGSVAVSFAEETAAADGSTASQRHGTPFPARDDDPAVAIAAETDVPSSFGREHGHASVCFVAGTAAANGCSASQRHGTPYPGKEGPESASQQQQHCCQQQVKFCVPAGGGGEHSSIERKGTPFAGRGRQSEDEVQEPHHSSLQQLTVVHVHFAVAQSESEDNISSPVRKGTPYPTRGRADSNGQPISDEQVILREGNDLAAAAATAGAAGPAVSVRFVIAGGRQHDAAAANELVDDFVRHDTPHPSKSRPRAEQGSPNVSGQGLQEVSQQPARDARRTAGTAGTSGRRSTSSSRVSFDLSSTSRKCSSQQPIRHSSSSSSNSSRRPSMDRALSGGSEQQQGKPGAPPKAQLSLSHHVSVHHIPAAQAIGSAVEAHAADPSTPALSKEPSAA